MKRLIAAVALVSGLMGAGQALAADYYVVTNDDRQKQIVNLSTIKRTGNYAIVETITIKTDNNSYVVFTEELDCVRSQLRIKALYGYRRNHSLIAGGDRSDPWVDLGPGSVGEVVLRSVCDPEARKPDLIVSSALKDIVDEYFAKYGR